MNRFAIGNDIVDLKHRTVRGIRHNPRFLKRILDEVEQDMLAAAADAEFRLWALWAAKETAYKTLCKLGRIPVFEHRKFVVTLPDYGARLPWSATVNHAGWQTQVCIENLTEAVHAHTSDEIGGAFQLMYGCRRRRTAEESRWEVPELRESWFTLEELRGLGRMESLLSRVELKRALCARLDLRPRQLEISRKVGGRAPTIPLLSIDGAPSDIDISLSHHGSWLAWACSIPHTTVDREHR